MSFKALPLDMISVPNYYGLSKDGMWVVTNQNQQTLWMALEISDSLGDRPYVPANGATLTWTFQRADLLSVNMGSLVNTNQTLIKNATPNAANRSLWSVALTQLDSQVALSGTIKFTLLESGVPTVWLQNWVVKKLMTDPGC